MIQVKITKGYCFKKSFICGKIGDVQTQKKRRLL